jgi:hypothetical protein
MHIMADDRHTSDGASISVSAFIDHVVDHVRIADARTDRSRKNAITTTCPSTLSMLRSMADRCTRQTLGPPRPH